MKDARKNQSKRHRYSKSVEQLAPDKHIYRKPNNLNYPLWDVNVTSGTISTGGTFSPATSIANDAPYVTFTVPNAGVT
ncbi:MAG: hypothetical protein FWG92_07430, partial [Leptospirales bacterium]|nr:hypothetical protein [Leptospirales bacterium]